MHPVMYSHRLKTVLQHTVRELGVTLSLSDEHTDLDLAQNEPMIRETATLLGLQVRFEQSGNVNYITFFK